MNNKENVPRANKGPVHTRRNIESFGDPYIEDEQIGEYLHV